MECAVNVLHLAISGRNQLVFMSVTLGYTYLPILFFFIHSTYTMWIKHKLHLYISIAFSRIKCLRMWIEVDRVHCKEEMHVGIQFCRCVAPCLSLSSSVLAPNLPKWLQYQSNSNRSSTVKLLSFAVSCSLRRKLSSVLRCCLEDEKQVSRTFEGGTTLAPSGEAVRGWLLL